jgi:saccharopine dehydrogenase-like NADP-dependent oxidoreductase
MRSQMMKDADAVSIFAIAADARRHACAIETRTPLVTTNYAKSIADLAPAAERAGVSITTECGLDSCIDLFLCARRAAVRHDHRDRSYCGGILEPKARSAAVLQGS